VTWSVHAVSVRDYKSLPYTSAFKDGLASMHLQSDWCRGAIYNPVPFIIPCAHRMHAIGSIEGKHCAISFARSHPPQPGPHISVERHE
jgi:hypothetical protein